MKDMAWQLCVGVSLALGVSGLAAYQRGGAPATRQVRSDVGRHVAVVVSGDVSVRRRDWNQPAPVRFGTVLRPGDLLTLPAGASAIIVCDGFVTAAKVTGQGIKAVPCGSAARRIPTWKHGPIIPTARIEAPGLNVNPTGIMAKTYEPSPSLEWPAVPGADAYDISISGPDLAWHDTYDGCAKDTGVHVCSAEVESFDAPPKLRADAAYLLAIKPRKSHGTYADTITFRQAFMVVNRPSEADIQTEIGALAKLEVAPAIIQFLTAKILAVSGAHDAAIRLFQLLRLQLVEPAIDLELAEVYRAKGSEGEAEKLLEGALLVYVKNGDVLGRALAEEALANILVKVADRLPSALTHLKNALDIYENLGDGTEMERVKKLLAAATVVSGAR